MLDHIRRLGEGAGGAAMFPKQELVVRCECRQTLDYRFYVGANTTRSFANVAAINGNGHPGRAASWRRALRVSRRIRYYFRSSRAPDAGGVKLNPAGETCVSAVTSSRAGGGAAVNPDGLGPAIFAGGNEGSSIHP